MAGSWVPVMYWRFMMAGSWVPVMYWRFMMAGSWIEKLCSLEKKVTLTDSVESNSSPISSSISNYVTVTANATLKLDPTSPYTGETVTLTCSVNSESNWRYNWYKDGTYIPVTQSGRLSITENTLTISSVKVSDKGSYQCHGYQHDRPTSTSTSNQVTITVKALPTATLKLYPTSPYTGEKVTLTCSVNSESNWRYTWNKDGIYIPVTQSGRLSITENTLTISSVKVSDKGSYRCHGNLDDRPTSTSTSNQVTITVKALPTATLKLYPTSPYTGEKVTLTCSVNSESNWRYTWNKDGIYIPVTQSGRLSITENTLTISSVKVSDKGSYRCHGNLDDRPTSTSTSNQVTITVKALPTATLKLYPTSPYTGEKVTLTCSVNSESNWRYTWNKDGIYIPVTQSGRLSITENTLTISSVKVSDKGSYRCHGNLDDRPTSTSTSNQVTITVKGKMPRQGKSTAPTGSDTPVCHTERQRLTTKTHILSQSRGEKPCNLSSLTPAWGGGENAHKTIFMETNDGWIA
ncbi:peroxidasin-like [Esox lucius]|uniref:peroxidasin-like n=1 Tax=Esox lucius TaxID=8010 RepID=UPI001476ED7A|nr:peroxidasin-like [Esox lucius]